MGTALPPKKWLIKAITNKMMKIKNKTRAIVPDKADKRPKPKNPATIATSKNIRA